VTPPAVQVPAAALDVEAAAALVDDVALEVKELDFSVEVVD